MAKNGTTSTRTATSRSLDPVFYLSSSCHVSSYALRWQDDLDKVAAQHLALAAANLAAKPSSSLQQSKVLGAKVARGAQGSAHVHPRPPAADQATADSPNLDQQVGGAV